MAERERDVLAFLGERAGDALRHFVDALGDDIADRGDVLRQAEMDAADRGADLFGLADQSVALAGEFAQQVADADFVVVIGALQRGDFVVDQRFELGGAGERALDAVTHRRDLAADRLADIDDRLARGGFRLGELDGDFRHGLRDQAQVLGAADGVREGEEHRDRQQHRGAGGDHRTATAMSGSPNSAASLARKTNAKAAMPTTQRTDRRGRGQIGHAARAALQRLEDLADRGAVIIGGAAHCAVFGPRGGLQVVVEQVARPGGRGCRPG